MSTDFWTYPYVILKSSKRNKYLRKKVALRCLGVFSSGYEETANQGTVEVYVLLVRIMRYADLMYREGRCLDSGSVDV